ncbi:MAG TPA: sodium/proton-translocating pyrophosphatase, partial [Thermoanaerobaculia bacterium]
MDSQTLLYAVPVCGVLALVYAALKSGWINRQDAGNEVMTTIAGHIREGAMAFLRREYAVLAIFVVVVAALLALVNRGRPESSVLIGVSVVAGAVCSAAAGFFGMRVATAANVRTAAAARGSLNDALKVAFSGGAVMGFCVVGLGLVGLSVLYLVYDGAFGGDLARVINVLTGFSFGASSIALFARVGGGIYTKAADVGADLVGKVEAGIPEDDPRNPAVIADNVGDNVGDVAGMGADLFESMSAENIGAMILGVAIYAVTQDIVWVMFPLVLRSFGIVATMIGTLSAG